MWWLEIILLEKWKWQIDKFNGERETWNWKAMLNKNSRFKRKIANKKTNENKMQCDVVFIQATFRLNHLSNATSMKRNWKFAINLTNDDDDDGFAI